MFTVRMNFVFSRFCSV